MTIRVGDSTTKRTDTDDQNIVPRRVRTDSEPYAGSGGTPNSYLREPPLTSPGVVGGPCAPRVRRHRRRAASAC